MKALDIPIVVFDRKTQTIYQISHDDTKIAISGKTERGRYSERVSKKPDIKFGYCNFSPYDIIN